MRNSNRDTKIISFDFLCPQQRTPRVVSKISFNRQYDSFIYLYIYLIFFLRFECYGHTEANGPFLFRKIDKRMPLLVRAIGRTNKGKFIYIPRAQTHTRRQYVFIQLM